MVKRGGRLRPTKEREGLHRAVLALRKDGLCYSEITRKVEEEHGATLHKSHISGWVNPEHQPFGYVTVFDAKPCPELAYVIGVKWVQNVPFRSRGGRGIRAPVNALSV